MINHSNIDRIIELQLMISSQLKAPGASEPDPKLTSELDEMVDCLTDEEINMLVDINDKMLDID